MDNADRHDVPNGYFAGLFAAMPKSQLIRKLSKFAAGSLISTAISQVVLIGLYGIAGRGALTASVLAFIAGAIPNFLINRHWAWGRRGLPDIRRELLPYLAVIITGGLCSTGLTTVADHLLQPLLTNRGWRTAVLDMVYVGSYGVFFVIKFALLDRLVFGSSRDDGEAGQNRDTTGTRAATSRS